MTRSRYGLDGAFTPSMSVTVTRTATSTEAFLAISSTFSRAAPLTTASESACVCLKIAFRLSLLLPLRHHVPKRTADPVVEPVDALVDGVLGVAEHVHHGLLRGADEQLVPLLDRVRVPELNGPVGDRATEGEREHRQH